MTSAVVVGLDPGLAALGLAVVELRVDSEVVLDLAVIRTRKSKRKRAVRTSEDSVRRCRELAGALDRALPPATLAIAAEAQSWPRSASAAVKVAQAWGVIAAVAERRGLPVLQVTPGELKRAVTGSATASKEDVQAALEVRYGALPWPSSSPAIREHCGDALGALLACLDSEVVQLARRMIGQGEVA